MDSISSWSEANSFLSIRPNSCIENKGMSVLMPLSFLFGQESKACNQKSTTQLRGNKDNYICEQNEVLEASVKMSLLL
jgi:hypothetical protein